MRSLAPPRLIVSWSSSLSLVLLLVASLALPGSAEARRKGGGDATLIGYRVVVEPDIVEGRGGSLQTRALLWKLRAIYKVRGGTIYYVRPSAPPRAGRVDLGDSEVRVDRPWHPRDRLRESPLFERFEDARIRFEGLRRSPDITLVEAPAPGPEGPPPPPRKDKDKDKDRKPPPDCASTLIDKGHSSSFLDKCRGVHQGCAVALLERGHHPMHLDECRWVEGRCARALLAAGHSPTHLDKCTVDLPAACTKALLRAGHHPMHLDNCAGVRERCADKLLSSGRHPSNLRDCRGD